MNCYVTCGIIQKNETYNLRLTDGYSWHKYLWKLFASIAEKRLFLFRVDEKENFFKCYVLSSLKPSLIPPEWEIKEVKESFLEHKTYRFQLKANPTKSLSLKGEKDDGKRVGIYDWEDLEKWFARKAENSGFRVLSASISAPISEFFNKKECKNKLNRVDFEGILEVLEQEKFKSAFQKGIGSAKSMGYGMLVVQPIKSL